MSEYMDIATGAQKVYPSDADVVEVVRCKDCKHKEHCFSMVHMYIKNQRDVINRDIDYCSYGERKK